MTTVPSHDWWTVAEIAATGLPDMPRTTRGVQGLADRNDWRANPQLARRRSGRGGGWEYNWKLFALAARRKLLADAADTSNQDATKIRRPREDAWAWYETLPEPTKEKAAYRLDVIRSVEAMAGDGITRYLAVAEVARLKNVSGRTIWNWLSLIEGVRPDDRLPYLAPRHRMAPALAKSVGSSGFWDMLKTDFLRLEAPSFASAYRRAVRIAEDNGWAVLPERTARRRMAETVPLVTQVFARKGLAGLEACFPPQIRDRTSMVAMEGVNADCHKVDLFVAWEDGTIDRPQIIAFQDLFSGKILAWRVDHSPNRVAVMSAFGDMVEEYGIPQRCLFDNGREFANKWLTGGVPTRFRFKVREDDPLGVLPQLGIEVHWARPASGRSKPIERAFRDFADDIVKDPRFAGAWVGNRPDAKPENYGSRAVPVADFLRVLEEGVSMHNARPGRRTATAMGRSFDETFAASYATAPIRKATVEQQRLWLMGQEVKTLQKGHGRFTLHDNEYWSDWMAEFAGQKVIVRFDPEDLHAGACLYSLDGGFLGQAECQKKIGFFDLAHAKEEARLTAAHRRAHRKLLQTHRPAGTSDVAARLDDLPITKSASPDARVVRGQFGKNRSGQALMRRVAPRPQHDAETEARQAAMIAEFRIPDQPQEAEETSKDRFRRALGLEERAKRGEPVGVAEAEWLAIYRNQTEYRQMQMMFEDFGEAMFAN